MPSRTAYKQSVLMRLWLSLWLALFAPIVCQYHGLLWPGAIHDNKHTMNHTMGDAANQTHDAPRDTEMDTEMGMSKRSPMGHPDAEQSMPPKQQPRVVGGESLPATSPCVHLSGCLTAHHQTTVVDDMVVSLTLILAGQTTAWTTMLIVDAPRCDAFQWPAQRDISPADPIPISHG